MEQADKIWMDGRIVDWSDAHVHLVSNTLQYGFGVFEGIRCYKTNAGPAVFRLKEHLSRLHNSAKILGFEIPYSIEQLIEATPPRLVGRNRVVPAPGGARVLIEVLTRTDGGVHRFKIDAGRRGRARI